MNYLLILLLNFIVYRDAIYFNLINDDSTLMKFEPFDVKRAKITSIVLHTMVAEYICLAFGSVGFIAALMFSIHPFAIQVPVWWSGKEYGKNALLVLMGTAFAPLGGVMWLVTENSIPNVLFTPLVFAFSEYWYLAFLSPLLVIIFWRRLKQGINLRAERQELFTAPNEFKTGKFKWANLVIVVKTFGFYSLASLLPIKNGFYNSFLVTIGSSKKETDYWFSLNRHFWGGLLGMAIMGIVWAFNIHNYIGMGIMLFVLSIGPYLNFITVQMWTSPRYAYIALIGFQVALVGFLIQFGTPGYCILSALWLFYLDRTLKVKKIYEKDNITMMELDSQVFPDNPRLWYYRYEHMLHKHNPLMAWAEASYGLKHLPEDCQLWFGLACASFELGDMNAAGEFLKNSERFMILTERRNMQGLIEELRQRIKDKLLEKYTKGRF